MFIAAQFAIIKIWKQPKDPITDGWVDEEIIVYIQMKYYSALKKRNLGVPCNRIGPGGYHAELSESVRTNTEWSHSCGVLISKVRD